MGRLKKHKRLIIVSLCVAGGILNLWLVFWGVIQPFIAKFYMDADIYEGIHYIQNNSYMEFDGGEEFSEVLQKYGVLEWGEITEFIYFDNQRSDNPIYGSKNDIFVLSCSLQSDVQYQEKKEFLLKNTWALTRTTTFEYYGPTETEILGVQWAFQDSTRTIRLVYATEIDHPWEVSRAIAHNSRLYDMDSDSMENDPVVPSESE